MRQIMRERPIGISQLPESEGSERATAHPWIMSSVDVGQAMVSLAIAETDNGLRVLLCRREVAGKGE